MSASIGKHDDLITVIGRGNSGTRILAHALLASGVFMGSKINHSGDMVPPTEMYGACRVLAQHVRWRGGLSWDFSELQRAGPSPEFVRHVNAYLKQVLGWSHKPRGWKLPETTLAYPWLVKMFPGARYIHIVRDPRDCLLSGHKTDDMSLFDVAYPPTEDPLDQRIASWKYQHDIVRSVPTPQRFHSVKFENLVLEHDATMQTLEDFLGIQLARVVVDPSRVGKWRSDSSILSRLQPLADEMRACGYA